MLVQTPPTPPTTSTTPATCVTRWQGEAIDWDLAVGLLFPYTPDCGTRVPMSQ